MGVRDCEHGRAELSFLTVQCGQCFALACRPDDDRRVPALLEVESVQRLTVLQHHVVGDVHDVVDRTLAGLDERVLQPTGRRADLHAGNQARGVAVAEVGVGNLDCDLAFDIRAAFGVRVVGFGHALTGNGRDLVRDSEDREAVRTVRRDLGVQNRIAEIAGEWRADRSVVVQHEDAFMVLAESQLERRADHSRRLDAPDARALEGLHLAGAWTVQACALPGERDLLSGGNVRRAADDGGRLAVTDVDGGQL